MILVQKVPLEQPRTQALEALLSSEAMNEMVRVVKAQIAELEAMALNKAVEAGVKFNQPRLQGESQEMLCRAVELQIFLKVVDAFSSPGYVFYTVKLTPY